MRRLKACLIASLALAWTACGETPEPQNSPQPEWGFDELDSDSPAAERSAGPPVGTTGPVAPAIRRLRPGSWVHGESGACVEREDWLVVRTGGTLDHVQANRNSCGAPSLARHAGRWSTDQHLLKTRWSNASETVTRQTTYWNTADTLRLGAFVPADGGWLMTDITTRKIGGFDRATSVDIGLRVDEMELSDGADCQMTATVSVSSDEDEATERFEFSCTVRAEGEGFSITADALGSDRSQWLAMAEERGLWTRHGATLATAIYEAFVPVLHTNDGQALWIADGSVYRFTHDSPPTSTDELGE